MVEIYKNMIFTSVFMPFVVPTIKMFYLTVLGVMLGIGLNKLHDWVEDFLGFGND